MNPGRFGFTTYALAPESGSRVSAIMAQYPRQFASSSHIGHANDEGCQNKRAWLSAAFCLASADKMPEPGGGATYGVL
ncbi:MAG: hypothetical protein AAGA91_20495, partial [Pseudomonadota bacterium]